MDAVPATGEAKEVGMFMIVVWVEFTETYTTIYKIWRGKRRVIFGEGGQYLFHKRYGFDGGVDGGSGSTFGTCSWHASCIESLHTTAVFFSRELEPWKTGAEHAPGN